MEVIVNISEEQIIKTLHEDYTYEQVIEFIANLDATIADSAFTEQLIALAARFQMELDQDKEDVA